MPSRRNSRFVDDAILIRMNEERLAQLNGPTKQMNNIIDKVNTERLDETINKNEGTPCA